MAPKNAKKGLEDLTDIAEEVASQDPRLLLLDKQLAEVQEAAHEAILLGQEDYAQVEAMLQHKCALVGTVNQADFTIRTLANKPGTEYYELVQAKKEMLAKLNSPKWETDMGTTMYRVPDRDQIRVALRGIDARLEEADKNIQAYWAGYFGVTWEEAVAEKARDDAAYAERK